MRWTFSALSSLCLGLSLTAWAREQVLFTSSITYCAPPDVLIVQEFDIQYFNSNMSIAFALSATNLVPNLNATANIVFNTYGLTPYNTSFDLCNILHGQLDLCPLPQANVTGRAYIPIPSLVQLPIPGIAFSIPDLEAVAQLTLRRVESKEIAVCLQSTLSNGRSLHTVAVQKATFIVSILSFISSLVHSLFQPTSSPIVFRTITLWSFFQHIALSGTLHLNYPLAYTAFTTNFAWSLGLFSNSQALQDAITRMRTLTGSSILSDAAEQPGAYTDRALSPYNLRKHSRRGPSSSALIARNPEGPKSIDLGSIVGGSSTTTPPAAPQHNYVSPALITSSSQTLAPGIPTFVNYVGIPTGNAWMSVFFGMLFLWIGYAGILVFTWLAALALMHSKRTKQIGENLRHELPRIATEGAIRLLQISFLPVLVFTLFQWTLHDNWLSTFISVLAFLTTFCCFGWLAVQVVQAAMVNTKIPSILLHWTEKLKRNRPINEDGHIATSAELEEQGSIEPESSPSKLSRSFALFIQRMRVTAVPAFVAPYRPSRQAFALLSPLLLTIFKAFFIALAKTHGFTQVIVLLIIESSHLLAIIWLKPFYPRFRDGPNPSADDLNTAHTPPSSTLSPEVESSECKSPDSKLTTGKMNSPHPGGIDSNDSSIASPLRQRQRRKANFFSRRGDFLELFLSILRIISTAGLLPFVREKLSVEAIPRVVVGIGIAVVCSVGVIVLAMNIVVHLLPWKALWRKGRRNEGDQTGTSPQPDQATEPSKEIP